MFHQTSTLNWLEMGFQVRFFAPGFSRSGIFSEAQLVEIYNDQLRDLLAEGGRDPGRGDERSAGDFLAPLKDLLLVDSRWNLV